MRRIPLPASPCDAPDAKTRLLSVAERLFAERGLKSTSIRELANEAGVNIAAVNYYFRSKDELYLEALRHAMRRSGDAQPSFNRILDEAVADGTIEGAREGIRRFIEVFVTTLYNTDGCPNYSAALMSQEMLHPTGALKTVIEEFIRPKFKVLGRLVKQARPDLTNQREISMTCMSIVAQCLHVHFTMPVSMELVQWEKMTPARVKALAEHIADFSLKALSI
jgi:TetR/AcrR family transcriptional regulator, regulator of cefoperazone and chloramphenicol sensitivity